MTSRGCPSCGFAAGPDAQFCERCGAPLGKPAATRRGYTPQHLAEKILRTRAALQGERKVITVMFADLQGSTALAEQVGAEAWHLILEGLFERLATAVHRYEGTVNQYTGDGVMALFGAPIAHEDHADRACLAAGDIRAAMRDYAAQVRGRHGIDIGLRIGLNSGDVVVGRIGDDLRMDYTAQGLTVNLAQRMEALCAPGQVVMTRHTAARLRGRFDLRSLGSHAPKGASQPVEAFALESNADATHLERPLAGAFIGRAGELSRLRGLVDALPERGGAVAVAGAAGIGKSRLCRELLESLPEGVHRLRAWCTPYADAYPLAPARRLLRESLGIDLSDPVAAREAALRSCADAQADAPLREAWLGFLGISDAAPSEPSAGLRARLLALAADRLLDPTRRQLLLVEDIHWADAGTAEFLQRVLALLPSRPSLLVVNYRAGERPPWLAGDVAEILLQDLDGDDLQRFCATLLEHDEPTRMAAGRILLRTRGNPFFIQEAVRDLRETGYLEGEPGQYRLARSLDGWQIPDSVHALIAARVDRLPDAQKRALEAAAVIGLRFTAPQLAWLLEQPLAETLPLLRGLRHGGFLEETPGELRFAHPLIQEVVYRTQLVTRRREVHARIAEEADRLHPADGPPSEAWLAAAHHWTQAEDWPRAGAGHLRVARFVSGADPVAAARAFREAARALDQAPENAEILRDRIAARSGMLLQLQLLPLPDEEVERLFREAQQIALRTRNLAALGELFIAYSIALLQRGDAAGARRLMGDVVAQAIATGNGASVARFRMTVLLVYTCAGMPREGIALVDKATGADWRTGPVTADNFVSRGFLGFMQCWLGELDLARDNLLAARRAGGGGDGTAWLDAFHADHAWLSGDANGVLEVARTAERRAGNYGAPFITAITRRALAQALMLGGEPLQAVHLLEGQRGVVVRGGAAHHVEGLLLSSCAQALVRAGRTHEAAATAAEALAGAQRSRSRLWEAIAWLALMETPAGSGPRAEEGLAATLGLIDAMGAEGLRPWWWLAKARVGAPSETAHCREQSIAAFERIGAHAHAARWRAQDITRPR